MPFTIIHHHSPSFTIIHHHSPPFTIHHSPFTIHHSPFTIHHSPFTIHHSPFTIHHSPLSYMLLKHNAISYATKPQKFAIRQPSAVCRLPSAIMTQKMSDNLSLLTLTVGRFSVGRFSVGRFWSVGRSVLLHQNHIVATNLPLQNHTIAAISRPQAQSHARPQAQERRTTQPAPPAI
jgi:hypothetical protein